MTHRGQVRVDRRDGAAPVHIDAGMDLTVDATGVPATPTPTSSEAARSDAGADADRTLATPRAPPADARAARALVLAIAGLALWLLAALLWARRRGRLRR